MPPLISVTEERNEIAVIASKGPRRAARRVDGADHSLVVIEAAKLRFCVALEKRGIRCTPVQPGARVAEQVKCAPSERVTTLIRLPAGLVQ